MRGDYIATLDIGSSNVRVIVAEIENGKPHVAGIGSAVSRGMRKGAIIDIDHTVESIREAVDKAEQMVGIDISDVYVGISGDHISLQPSHGVVAVSGESREIGREDIERVLEASRMTALPPERAIIEVVPKQFIVDGLGGIRDPSRMIGVRLEVDAILVTGTKTIVHNVLRCVERASLTVSGFVLLPLAAGEYCLSPDEKNLGVVFADIGGGATSLAIFEHGHLVATAVVPIGGEYITNDIAIWTPNPERDGGTVEKEVRGCLHPTRIQRCDISGFDHRQPGKNNKSGRFGPYHRTAGGRDFSPDPPAGGIPRIFR